MPDSADLVQVHVDFNDMESDGLFFVLPDDADGELTLRSQVLLQDGEGNGARGTVVEVLDRGRAMVAMIAGSWHRDEVVADSDSGTFQEQVANLLALYAPRPASFDDLYRLREVSSAVAAQTASPPSGLPQPRGAVLSSL